MMFWKINWLYTLHLFPIILPITLIIGEPVRFAIYIRCQSEAEVTTSATRSILTKLWRREKVGKLRMQNVVHRRR